MGLGKRFVCLEKSCLSMGKIEIKCESGEELRFFGKCLDDYVGKERKVGMVDDIIGSMEMKGVMDSYDGIGGGGYSGKMVVSLVVFGYMNGVYWCGGIGEGVK